MPDRPTITISVQCDIAGLDAEFKVLTDQITVPLIGMDAKDRKKLVLDWLKIAECAIAALQEPNAPVS